MKSELQSRLNLLSEKMNNFYYKKFSSEAEEYIENKSIKSDIIEVIIKSNELGEFSLVQDALFFIFENTGCKEDFEILDEIISPLLKNNILDEKLLKKHFGNSPLSRWKEWHETEKN
ncbi:hypothetical protein [Pantoea sp. A4]|uniref:hypothetical protein n=1 Tax=Pantoea sp. A4 TaxID=1225184 RepID=UPI0005652525|nr:hypothetical protein [Pantoea sp. A4]